MSQQEIREEREAREGKRIARPGPADEQLPLFAEGKEQGENLGEGEYLNEHLFPRSGWPGWNVGPTLLQVTDPEEFERVRAFAKETLGIDLI